MTSEAHYRKLERAYRDAPTNEYYDPEIEIGEAAATVRVRVDPKFYHAADAVHGSVYFKLLDDAAFFAANSLVPDHFVLTANFNLHLLAPVSEGTMTATGRVIHRRGRSILAEARLVDDEGELVAYGSGTFVESRIELGPEVGYGTAEDPG